MINKEFPGLSLVWKKTSDYDPQSLSSNENEIAEEFKNSERRKQFTLGRQAIKEALSEAGLPQPKEVLRGEKGEPILPEGYSGSISHSSDSAVAIAAAKFKFNALGVDIEKSSRELKDNIYKRIANDKETDWINENSRTERSLRLVSAKEALFKALYPLCKVYFGMLDAELVWNEDESAFEATLLKNLSAEFQSGNKFKIGSYSINDFLVSVCALDR